MSAQRRLGEVWIVGALWLVGCAGPTGDNQQEEPSPSGCQEDADCGQGRRCEVESGVCVSACVPGESRACACAGEQSGSQRCTEDGEYGACVCDPGCPPERQRAWYPDLDQDGFGDSGAAPVEACDPPDDHVDNNRDCNDAALAISPNAEEIVGDGFDQDCDGQDLCFVDADEDGVHNNTWAPWPVGGCVGDGVVGQGAPGGDCDDRDSSVKPGADEIAGDERDQDCDGAELCFTDSDNDGFRGQETARSNNLSCQEPGEAAVTTPEGDCDDMDRDRRPGLEDRCDGIDNDCDGDTDEDGEGSCGANAACVDARCACQDGYEGDGQRCQDVDECEDDPCPENARCQNSPGGFTCACQEGFAWDGAACADIDECEGDPCHRDARCQNSPGGFRCTCNPGYEGDGVACADVDECARGLDDCDANAECENTPGGFSCGCEPGYETRQGRCQDIDECDRNLDDCDANAACANTPGGFACACAEGYEGDGRACVDVNECNANLSDCDEDAGCQNSPGGFVCACNPGYEGDGRACADIDECARGLDDCAPGEDCQNSPGGFVCRDMQIDAARLTSPPRLTVEPGQATEALTARVFEGGLTDVTTGDTGLRAQIGYGPPGSAPLDPESGWVWRAAAFAGDFGTEDAYSATLQLQAEGRYEVAFRFSLDGARWALADRDGSGNGYDAAQASVLEVMERPIGAPSLESLAPTEGLASGGAVVVLRGQGFDRTARVAFGEVEVTPEMITSDRIEVVAPPGPVGWVDVSVRQGEEESRRVEGFVYLAAQAQNDAPSLWGPNSLGELSVTWTDSNLYLWLRAEVEPQNALVLYLDRDFGEGTGIGNLSGQGEGALQDNQGSVDDALSGTLSVEVEGFGAEMGFGMLGLRTSDNGFQDLVGWRLLAGFSSDFAWVDTSEAPVSLLDDGRVQLIVPWSTIYGQASPPEGARLGLFARITNRGGALYNNAQTLPLDDPEDPGRVQEILALEP